MMAVLDDNRPGEKKMLGKLWGIRWCYPVDREAAGVVVIVTLYDKL
jgi:hypothetical protein